MATSKWHKWHKRDDSVPKHMFSEMHYEKNQMLEQEYLQSMDDAFGR